MTLKPVSKYSFKDNFHLLVCFRKSQLRRDSKIDHEFNGRVFYFGKNSKLECASKSKCGCLSENLHLFTEDFFSLSTLSVSYL